MDPNVLNRAQRDPEFYKCIREVRGRGCGGRARRAYCEWRCAAAFKARSKAPSTPQPHAGQRRPHAGYAAALD
jgi:hypothetical protein